MSTPEITPTTPPRPPSPHPASSQHSQQLQLSPSTPQTTTPNADEDPRRSFVSLFSHATLSARFVSKIDYTRIDLPTYVYSLCLKLKRPVVVNWIRHYGCTLCYDLARKWQNHAALNQTNAIFLMVGQGTVQQMRGFARVAPWREVYTSSEPIRLVVNDENLGTYRVMRWERGYFSVFNRKSFKKVVRSMWEGNEQIWSWKTKSADQQGGLVVVNKDGKVCWTRREEFAGDHVDINELVQKIWQADRL